MVQVLTQPFGAVAVRLMVTFPLTPVLYITVLVPFPETYVPFPLTVQT